MSLSSAATLIRRQLSATVPARPRITLAWLVAGLLSLSLNLPVGAARAEETGQVSEPVPTETGRMSLTLKRSTTLEIGLHRSSLTQGNPAWSGAFVKGSWQSNARLSWLAEISAQRRFDDQGVYLSLGANQVFNDDWYGTFFASSSAGGFFLPRYRFDAFLSRKWLEARQLITTVGISHINAKDEHRDLRLFVGSSYYFSAPWILEGGLYFNRSRPGDVHANSGFLALTQGRAGTHYLTLRYGAGREAYQLIGPDLTISDFASHSTSLVWRQWFHGGTGLNLRTEHYRNPFYRRNSFEFSAFQEF